MDHHKFYKIYGMQHKYEYYCQHMFLEANKPERTYL